MKHISFLWGLKIFKIPSTRSNNRSYLKAGFAKFGNDRKIITATGSGVGIVTRTFCVRFFNSSASLYKAGARGEVLLEESCRNINHFLRRWYCGESCRNLRSKSAAARLISCSTLGESLERENRNRESQCQELETETKFREQDKNVDEGKEQDNSFYTKSKPQVVNMEESDPPVSNEITENQFLSHGGELDAGEGELLVGVGVGEGSYINNSLASNFNHALDLNLDFDVVEELNAQELFQRRQESSTSRYYGIDKMKEINEDNLELWENIMRETGGKKVDYPHFKFNALRNRPLTDATAVFHHNAWDNIEWDEEMQTHAEDAVLKNTQTKMLSEKKSLLEEEADEHWDKFYQVHQNKFFKDRNWLFTEFPELEGPFGCSVPRDEFLAGLKDKRTNESYPGENSGFRILEVGCGAGNTVFPLLNGNNNPEVYLYCCDFSKTAVDIVRNHEKFELDRCTSFVLDITDDNPTTPFPDGSLDVITCIFVISAISPEKFDQVIKTLHTFLKPGGLILFRDYGRYDLAQLRFKDGRCISENFYVRGDGTRVYFFTPEEVENLFTTRGFSKRDMYVDRRLQVNRSKQLKMYRVWILAKFCKLLPTTSNSTIT